MKDLALDFINKKMLNETISGKDRVIQHITVAVRSWIGDFFLNENFGIDYDNSWSNPTLLESYIREQIEAIDGVFAISSIETEKLKTSDNVPYLKINVGIVYNNEEINITIDEIIGN